MESTTSYSNEIQYILKNHIKVESKVISLENIFGNIRMQNKINYMPYYQRNYVWDADKATYFIESILLGTEIPPLVFFNSDSGKIEVIDGRQRYETIKRFINNDIILTKQGLSSLAGLQKKKFCELDESIRNIILDTKLRILEFSIVNEPGLTDSQEDLIKKEIFRRYNSGITPLKSVDINRAIYNNDDVTNYFKDKLVEDKKLQNKITQLFFSENHTNKVPIDTIMHKIRHYLVLYKVPVKYYSRSSNRQIIIEKLYEIYMSNIDDIEGIFNSFKEKIDILINLQEEFDKLNIETNRLVFECVLWALYICDEEKLNIQKKLDKKFYDSLVNHIAREIEKYSTEQSHFYKKYEPRHIYTLEYFSKLFEKPQVLELYSESYNKKVDLSDANESVSDIKDKLNELKNIRLDKAEPQSTTVDDLGRLMLRGKFLIRPPYQRNEVINIEKSSAIIESILLDIKLPPIFIFRRKDGVNEVIDGQQRILSILGYIGNSFRDEKGNECHSNKNNFKLKGLTIYKELDKKKFIELDTKLQDKIYDFNLSIVTIDEDRNPYFNPIDLFIRLNNKPYPIKENSFEMWNSYIDKEIIMGLKNTSNRVKDWFYFRKNNTRMLNEEMFTAISYLNYQYSKNINDFNYLDIYQKGNRINFRISDKKAITEVLKLSSNEETYKIMFLKSVRFTESFTKKIELILIDKNVTESEKNSFLKQEIDRIFGVKSSSRRSLQDFYALWYIVNPININMIKAHREDIKKEVARLFEFMKDVPENSMDEFRKKIDAFMNLYTPDQRTLKLSEDQIVDFLNKQNNLCPICGLKLYLGDNTHNDHIIALAIGGKDEYDNIQVVHDSCNLSKGCKNI